MKILAILSTMIISFFSSAQGTMVSLDGTVLNITKSNQVLTIDGSGRHTFTITLGDERYDYSLNNVATDTGTFLMEGYILDTEKRKYDPFLMEISKEGDTLWFHIFENELDQDIKGAYPLEEGFLVHLASSVDNGQGTDIPYKHHLGILNNEGFETLKTNDRVTKVEENMNGYFVYFDYEDTPRYMFSYDGELLNEASIFGIEIHGVYEGEVLLQFLGEAKLNGIPIESPFKVTTPGKYTFTKSGKVIPFMLNPIVTGVISNTIYSDEVSINYSSGQAFLNDYHYAPNEPITKPGHYIFGIYGENYIYEIPFTISADIEGVSPMQTYTEPVQITFDGDAYLNNQYFASNTTIKEPGNYTLKVFGENDYLETISFKIEDENEVDQRIWVERALMGGSFVLGAGLIIKKAWKMRKK